MKNLLEICATNLQSAKNAEKGGADRVELCINILEGGETPSFGLIKQVREALSINVNVLIRPRPGSFVYSDDEIQIMLNDIDVCKELEVDGIVIGALNKNGTININVIKKLLDRASGMDITFNRAIDVSNDILKQMPLLIEVGVNTVLTSGGKITAYEGKDVIKSLHENFGDSINIMAGSGINPNNIHQIATYTGINSFHGTMSTMVSEDIQSIKKPIFGKNNETNEYQYIQSDIKKIKQIKSILNSL